MIRGHKPNAYFATADRDGKAIEGEHRQCVHCTYSWEYRPGSGRKRGFCLHCHGLLCMRAECAAEQRRLMAAFPDRTWSCMPFEDWNKRMLEQFAKDARYTVLPSGIAVVNQ